MFGYTWLCTHEKGLTALKIPTIRLAESVGGHTKESNTIGYYCKNISYFSIACASFCCHKNVFRQKPLTVTIPVPFKTTNVLPFVIHSRRAKGWDRCILSTKNDKGCKRLTHREGPKTIQSGHTMSRGRHSQVSAVILRQSEGVNIQLGHTGLGS